MVLYLGSRSFGHTNLRPEPPSSREMKARGGGSDYKAPYFSRERRVNAPSDADTLIHEGITACRLQPPG